MLGESVDPLGQQRDLHLGLAGVAGAGAEFLDQLSLAFLGDGHAAAEASRSTSAIRFAARTAAESAPHRGASAQRARRSNRTGARRAIGTGTRHPAFARTARRRG